MAFLSNRHLFVKRLLMKSLDNWINDSICYSNIVRLNSTDAISDTTLLMQDGRVIQELPLVIERVSSQKAAQILIDGKLKHDENLQTISNLDSEELREVITGFRNCNSFIDINKLLEVVPPSNIQPRVAYEVLKKLIEIEQVYSAFSDMISSEDSSSSWMKPDVVSLMMKVILNDKQGDVLISCMRSLNQNQSFKNYVASFQNQLHEQIMLNVTKNYFSVSQICDLAKEFRSMGYTKDVDKLWIGIVDHLDDISKDNILKLYQALPCFKTSLNVIANALLKKMSTIWWAMESRELAEILTISKKTRTHSYKLLQILGRWLNTKIHSTSEDELLIIINGFSNADFVNTQITSALERYIKVRGPEIKNSFLFAGIMDYFLKFRVRSPSILEKACDYFIMKKTTLSPVVVKSLFVPFGYLDYVPTRSYEFWKAFEEIFEEKFLYFSSEHVLDILMSCLYLEKYPINFVNNVFDPYFLNRLQVNCENWLETRKKLIMFDHIMTAECKSYKGPMLLRDLPTCVTITDERIQFMQKKIREMLVNVAGSADRVILNKCLRSCPIQSLCTVDIFLVPEDAKMPYLSNFVGTKSPFRALLIHLPEHYTFEETNLIGPQIIRKRHLEKLGVVVVSLNYLHLLKLCSQRGSLEQYIQESIKYAEQNFHSNRKNYPVI